ncbi:MAG TPA: extracellular solute-binding protein [Chloroflexota bacterium]|nr:extracellular solute-binding protein [Chloroflexota bacterium]
MTITKAGEKQTRRSLSARATLIAGTGILAACGEAGSGSQVASQPAAKSAKLGGKVVFLARGNEVELNGQREVLIPTFKQVAPEVEIVHEVVSGGTSAYNEKLITMWTGGSPPDVWGFGMNYMAYWARGMVADLTPLITRDKLNLDQFLPGLMDKFKVKGKYYGLPQQTTFGTLLFYNKTLFDNAGVKHPPFDWEDKSWTYDAMLDAARKLTKNAGTAEAVYGLSYAPQMPTQAPWNFGGDAFRPEHYTEGIAPSSQLDSAPSLAAHEFFQDVAWRDHVSPQTGRDPSVGDFRRGRIAMLVSGGYNLWNFSAIKDFGWAAAPIPTKVNNKNVNYNDFWELAKDSKNQDAAWAFMKHLVTPEVQRQYLQLTGTPPTTKAALDDWYKRYESIMPRAGLEKLTQGAIDPKRSQESPDHLFIDWSRFDDYYKKEVRDPLNKNEGKPREVITRAKPGYDALMNEVYTTWKGKTPA